MPTACLLHFDGNLTDSGPGAVTFTAFGNAATTGIGPKFGSECATFDGTGDYLRAPGSSAFALGAGDFTVSCQIKTSTTGKVFLDFYGTGTGWQLLTASNGVQLYTTTAVKTGTINVCDGAWHQVVVMRLSGTVYILVDGVPDGAGVSYATNISGVPTYFAVGAQVSSRNAAYDWNGQVDEVLVFPGAALFPVAGFTPPTAAYAFPVLAGTVLDDTGAPCERTLRAYNRATGALLGSTTSNPSTGAYNFAADFDYAGVSCQIVCLDDVAGTTHNDLIFGGVVPA